MSVVETATEGSVGHVVLNRPEALNAITIELALGLEAALASLAGSVKVIVVRGAGGNFCAGGDFHEVERLRGEGTHALESLFEAFGRACSAIATLGCPVVAAVEGYAMAGGFELMQSCDMALASHEAVIGDNHANFAQVPGGGGSQRLPRLVGRQRALGLILSGERLSGKEAAAWGLAYRSYPADEFDRSVASFAAKLAGKDKDAAAKTKRLVYAGLRMPLEDGLALERSTVVGHLSGEAAGEAIQRFRKSEGAPGA